MLVIEKGLLSEKGAFAFVIMSLLIIAILTYLYITKKPSEPFCSCRNMTNKVCPDPKVLTHLYETGKLTEFTDFSKMEKAKNNWKNVMPEDQFATNNYT